MKGGTLKKTVAFVCLLGVTTLLPAPARATDDAYQLFAKTRDTWLHQRYPAYIDYTVAVTVDEGASPKTERYQSSYDATNNTIRVEPVSDWEQLHPASGKGVNLGFLFFPVNKPLPPVDFLGVPMLAPTYSFGMAPFVAMKPPHRFSDAEVVAQVRAQFHDPNPRGVAAVGAPVIPSGLHEIGSVVAFKRDYLISLLGEETIDGHRCYHLGLKPTRDYHRYRLRDVWVDETTHETRQLREAINFQDGPGTLVPWTIGFADIGGALYVDRESADLPMTYRGLLYRHATVSFEDIRSRTTPVHPMEFPPTNDLVMSEPTTP